MGTQPTNPTTARPQASKAKFRLSFGWKLRLTAIALGLIAAFLDAQWKTIDKYFPKLNEVLHAGAPTSKTDVQYLMAHLQDDLQKWSDPCTDDMTFEQCRARMISYKPVLQDLNLRVNQMSEAWDDEVKESNVPAACQAEMNHFVATYKNFVSVGNEKMGLLESMDSPEATKTLMIRYNGISGREDTAWQAYRQLRKTHACDGY